MSLLFAINTNAQIKDDLQISSVIKEQMAAWNAGDMDRYMNTYWRSDSLMFIGREIEVGWNYVLKNYKRAYPDTASMGKLDFEIINLKRLSVLYYSVVGKWHLKRSAGDQNGAFTLLLRRSKTSGLLYRITAVNRCDCLNFLFFA